MALFGCGDKLQISQYRFGVGKKELSMCNGTDDAFTTVVFSLDFL